VPLSGVHLWFCNC